MGSVQLNTGGKRVWNEGFTFLLSSRISLIILVAVIVPCPVPCLKTMLMDIPPLQPGPKWVTGASWWTSGELFLPDDTMRCKRVAYIFLQQDAEPVISSFPAQGLRPWMWLVWMRAAWLADNAETHPVEPWLMIWMWQSVHANLFVVGGVFRTNVSRTWRRARCRGTIFFKKEDD